jgi:hypothetical protein
LTKEGQIRRRHPDNYCGPAITPLAYVFVGRSFLTNCFSLVGAQGLKPWTR